MKKPIALLFTDTHLKKDNVEQNRSIFKQANELCKKMKIEKIIGLGDFFESREAQPLKVLKTFGELLLNFKDVEFFALAGNHDKVNLDSEDSYLDEFEFHPNLTVIRDMFFIVHAPIFIWFIPYFKEETTYIKYLSKIKEAQKTIKEIPRNVIQILCTHIAVNGVKNNENHEVMDGVEQSKFNMFDKVFTGHYHNQSKVGKNIYYIGSAYSKNFGEDNEKGFTILYDDGSHEFIKAEFKEYNKVVVDLNKEVNLTKLLSQYSNHKDYIRFEFVGSKEKLKSLDRNKFTSVGIDVKTKIDKIETKAIKNDEFIIFDKETIKEEFDKFCKIDKIDDVKYGKEKLNEILK